MDDVSPSPNAEEFTFSHPWERVDPGSDVAGSLARELSLELARTHPLYGRTASIVGRSLRADDVLVAVSDGWAIVHLTWSGRPEIEGVPDAAMFDDAAKAQHIIDVEIAEQDEDWETYGSAPGLVDTRGLQ